MKSWICYTEFGCPSGHSWMGLVLMEFIVKFLARGYPSVRKRILLGYLLVALLQCLVMFSRVILGMHTFNEVLMGAMIGIFSIALYYTYLEDLMLKLVATLIGSPQGFTYFQSMESPVRRKILAFVLGWFVVVACAVDLTLTFLPTYSNN
jgi:membrane-associated phospholipid phosphatase